MFCSNNKKKFTADPNILESLKRHIHFLYGKRAAYGSTATDTGVFEVAHAVVTAEIDFLESLISQYQSNTQDGREACPE